MEINKWVFENDLGTLRTLYHAKVLNEQGILCYIHRLHDQYDKLKQQNEVMKRSIVDLQRRVGDIE